MDLHAGCFESTLYRCDDHRHVWYVKKHHLITDGVAFVEFFRQVESAYRGDALRVVPFAEQLRREHDSRAQPRFAELEAFWAERCAKAGTTAARQRHGHSETSRHSIVLSRDLNELLERAIAQPRLRAISRNLSVFSVLAAALFALRYRLFDRDARTLGMPVHLRTRGHAIGPVLEIGFLDLPCSDATTFAELVAMVQADALTVLKKSAPGISSAEINNSFSWLLNFVTTSFGSFAGLACKPTWIHPGAGDAAHTLRLQAHDFDVNGRSDPPFRSRHSRVQRRATRRVAANLRAAPVSLPRGSRPRFPLRLAARRWRARADSRRSRHLRQRAQPSIRSIDSKGKSNGTPTPSRSWTTERPRAMRSSLAVLPSSPRSLRRGTSSRFSRRAAPPQLRRSSAH